MNAFYALDDIRKRTKRFYLKLDQQDEGEGDIIDQVSRPAISPANEALRKQLFDDNFIFRHFY